MKNKKIRIYDLAKELKQDVQCVIEEARREGSDVSVPSNSLSKELADKMRKKYLSNENRPLKDKIRIIKKSKRTPDKISSNNKNRTPKKPSVVLKTKKKYKCQYCYAKVLAKRYKNHTLNECPKRPSITSIERPAMQNAKRKSSNNKVSSSLYLNEAKNVIMALSKGKKRNLNNKKFLKLLKTCKYCSVEISENNYNKHILSECPRRPNAVEERTKNKLLMNTEDISWEILPRGAWIAKDSLTQILEHFSRLQKNKKWKNKIFDKSRLNSIEEMLNPNKYFIGKNEFEGYIVYCFDWTEKVIIECPIYGNATYIINKGKYCWKEITKVSKWEARTNYSDQVTAVNHSETWIERVEQSLKFNNN